VKNRRALNWLVPLIIVLTFITAGVGLFYRSGSGPFPFTTVHGETVRMAGLGIYFHDTLFIASLSWGTDLVTLFIGVPLLAVAAWLTRRGSLRGGLLLTGVLAYFLYYGASLGLGTAYNRLFLVYIALFSASFYAFILAFTAFDLAELAGRLSPRLPRRGMAVFMVIVGAGLGLIWLSDAMAAALAIRPPAGLGSYTTIVTYTLDIGIIAVACILAAVQLFRRQPMGYLLSGVLNIMLVLVATMVIGQTTMQLRAGIPLTPGEIIGKSASFVMMGIVAFWLTVVLLRGVAFRLPAQAESS
jgi:hypothetical protein